MADLFFKALHSSLQDLRTLSVYKLQKIGIATLKENIEQNANESKQKQAITRGQTTPFQNKNGLVNPTISENQSYEESSQSVESE